MLTKIEAFLYSFVDDYKEHCWKRLIVKSILTLLTVLIFGFIFWKIVFWVLANIEQIVTTIGGILCFFWGLLYLMGKMKKNPPKPPELPEPANNYDPITTNTTYNTLRNDICVILIDLADVIKIRKPTMPSSIDAPTRFDVISNAVIYHFLVVKQSDDFDPSATSAILQNRIEQRLNNNELNGITQRSYFYNGQVFPSIIVDAVQDLGRYAQIDIALASDYYCRYREQRIFENLNRPDSSSFHDRDF